jgi:tRNA G18 (ribose-2'-O)-methylase SpoU
MPQTEVHVIESAQNPFMKDFRKLLGSRGIRRQGRALVAGPRLTAEVVARAPGSCLGWIVPTGLDLDLMPLVEGAVTFSLAPELFRELDIMGTHAPLLLVRVPQIPDWDPTAPFAPGCTLFLPFQDPENVGAALRSAAAFGVREVVLLTEAAHPFHPRSLRASAGAVFSLRFRQGPALAELSGDLPLVALSGEGAPIESVALPESFGLLPGLEGPGLPPAWRARSVSIPIDDAVESLNAAASVAVALYAWKRSADESRGE